MHALFCVAHACPDGFPHDIMTAEEMDAWRQQKSQLKQSCAALQAGDFHPFGSKPSGKFKQF